LPFVVVLSFPKALPFVLVSLFSQGVAIGLGYIRLSACGPCWDSDCASKFEKYNEFEKQIIIMDAGQNFCSINATQWQHTLAQRQRLGESEKQNG
jgi:hypothetical protein